MKKTIFLFLTFSLLFILIDPVEAALTCSVTSGSCSGTTVFEMQSTSNAHAELTGQPNFIYKVCCSGITGLGNSCSGNYAVALNLSAPTNAHVEKNTYSNFSNYACLSAPSENEIECVYGSSCSADYACLASISANTNAHVGNCSAFPIKVCCGVIPTTEPTGSLDCQDSTEDSITLSYTFANGTNVSLFRENSLLTTFSGSSNSGSYTDPGLPADTSYNYYLRNGTLATSDLLDSVTCSTLAPPFQFDISLDPESDSIFQEEETQTEVTVSRIQGDPLLVTLLYSTEDQGSGTPFSNLGITFSWETGNTCIPNDFCYQRLRVYTSADTPAGTYYVLIGGSAPNSASASKIFTLSVDSFSAPVVVTVDHSNLTKNSVTLHGRLDDCGGADTCLVWFEYGTNPSSYDYSTSIQTVDCTTITLPYDFDSGTEITGLTPNTPYYFEAKAKNSGSW